MWPACAGRQKAERMYKTLEDYVGNTPLVRLKRMPGNTSNVVLAKLEGNNPAGSVATAPTPTPRIVDSSLTATAVAMFSISMVSAPTESCIRNIFDTST